MNYLDRNEFNFEPSQKVLDAVKNFDPKDLCFYTRIYDQGKKSVISVRVSEIYGVPEEQVLLAYGGEEILKNAIHYFLMEGNNKKILIPEFSWWYYNRVASECGGTFEMYPLYETDDTFAYNVDEVIAYTNRIHPRMLLLASPNNPTGNSLTSEEIGRIMENIPSDTMVLVDEAYASFITTDTDYIAPLVNKYQNLIISRTLSKFYGLPGLRCGFGFIGKGHDQFLSYSNKYLGFNRFAEAVAFLFQGIQSGVLIAHRRRDGAVHGDSALVHAACVIRSVFKIRRVLKICIFQGALRDLHREALLSLSRIRDPASRTVSRGLHEKHLVVGSP